MREFLSITLALGVVIAVGIYVDHTARKFGALEERLDAIRRDEIRISANRWTRSDMKDWCDRFNEVNKAKGIVCPKIFKGVAD